MVVVIVVVAVEEEVVIVKTSERHPKNATNDKKLFDLVQKDI